MESIIRIGVRKHVPGMEGSQEAKLELGMTRHHPPFGANDVVDWIGMRVASKTLLASIRPGKYADNLQ